jgi:hypothetical protein
MALQLSSIKIYLIQEGKTSPKLCTRAHYMLFDYTKNSCIHNRGIQFFQWMKCFKNIEFYKKCNVFQYVIHQITPIWQFEDLEKHFSLKHLSNHLTSVFFMIFIIIYIYQSDVGTEYSSFFFSFFKGPWIPLFMEYIV